MNTTTNHSCLNCPALAASVFAGCSSETLEGLKASKSEVCLSAGRTIFLEGMPVLGIYCQRAGEAEVFRTGGPGRPRVAYRTEPGAALGFKQLFDSATYAYSAVAVTDTNLCFIPITALMTLVDAEPAVLMEMVKRLCLRLDALEAPLGPAIAGA
jgi:CRP/FNR family transcriptional regulator, polysaccharide utilization system transcription regulator